NLCNCKKRTIVSSNLVETSYSDQVREQRCYDDWMKLQKHELTELLHALNLSSEGRITDFELTQLLEKIMDHCQDYCDQRSRLARRDAAAYFAPNWCSSLENFGLWVAGCRPSSFISLLYALSGLEIESKLPDFLQGDKFGDRGEYSAAQLSKINELQSKTIREEEKISLLGHEDMADQPLARVVMTKLDHNYCLDGDVNEALEENGQAMASLLEEADRLRLSTVKELIDILTPFLSSAKKLRLCMKEWGMKRDREHDRNRE
ncbi:hypothetical protein RJ639_019324, partial [Escallonia herrerae]